MPSLHSPESTPVTVIKVSPEVTYKDPVTGEDIPVKAGDVLSPDLALQLGAEGSLIMQQAGQTLTFQGSGVVSVYSALAKAASSESQEKEEARSEAAEADSSDATPQQLSKPSEAAAQVASPSNSGRMDLPVLVEPIRSEEPQLESATVVEKLSESLAQSSETALPVTTTPRVETAQETSNYDEKEPVPPVIESSPAAPGIPVITGISPDTGVDGDFITSAGQLVVVGTGIAGNTITLENKGDSVPGSATVDASGHWKLELSLDSEGEHQLTAFASNSEGFISPGSKIISVVLDSTPPVLEIEKTGLTTDSTSTTLQGAATAGLKFILAIDGKQYNVIADENGRWQQNLDDLQEGSHSVKGTACDVAGNQAGFEEKLQVSLTPDKPVITAIIQDTGADSTDFITNKGKYQLVGEGKPGTWAKLYWQKVLDDNSLDPTTHIFPHDTSVGASGQWEFNLKEDSDFSRVQYQVQLQGTGGLESPMSDPQIVTVDRVLPELQAAEMTSLTTNPEAVYKLTFTKEMASSGTPKVLLGESGSEAADLQSTDDPHSFTFSYSAPAGESVPNKIKGFDFSDGKLSDTPGNVLSATLPSAFPISGAPGDGPDNQLPTGADNTITLDEDGQHAFTAADFGFQDADGDALAHVTVKTLPDPGTLTLNDTPVTVGATVPAEQLGQLVYKPVADASGDNYASLQFTVNDGTADSATPNTLTFNVTAVNDAPTAEDKALTLAEDGQHTFSADDFGFQDADGDALVHVTVRTLPDQGTLTLNDTAVTVGAIVPAAQLGQLVYKPVADANGDGYASLQFTVNDGTADSATPNTLTFNVTAENDAPTAEDKTLTLAEDGQHTFSADDFGFQDADGDALVHVTVRTLPDQGTLTLNDTPVTVGAVVPAAQLGQLVYKPVADASGDNYASLQFTVNDGTADSATPNTLTFNVTAENDAPTAEDKALTLAEDGQHTFSAADFGFQDPDGDALMHVTVKTLPDQGTLTLNNTPVTVGAVVPAAQLGQLVYKPVADANGDGYASLQFTVNDGTADSATPNTLTFNVTAENDAPTAEDKALTLAEDGQHTFSADDFGFQDADGDALVHVTVRTLPDQGTLTLNDTPVTVGAIVPAAQLGQLVYKPVADASGDNYASLQFTVNDGTADSATPNTLTFNVTAVNDAPTAEDKALTLAEDGQHTFSADDFGFQDADGDALVHVTVRTLPDQGTLTLNDTPVTVGAVVPAAQLGQLVYKPVADASGDNYASLQFTVNDGTADSATPNTLTFNVTAENDAPTAEDKALTLAEDGQHTFSAADFGFQDADGDALVHVTVKTLPDPGTLTLNDTPVSVGAVVPAAQLGQLVYKPVADASGDGYASLQFTVNDGTADSATPNTLTFNVTAVNDAPTGTDKAVTVTGTEAYHFTAEDFGFQDVDGDALAHVTIKTLPQVGTLALDNAPVTANQNIPAADIAKLTFTAAAGGSGAGYAQFTFTVNDGTVDSAATNTITVDAGVAGNQPPTAADNTLTLDEDGQHTFSADDFGFQDADGDALVHVTVRTLPDQGTLTLNDTAVTVGAIVPAAQLGQLVYKPVADANGDGYASLQFTVNDGTADSATPNTLTFNVTAENDAPTAEDKALTLAEDGQHTFSADDFGFQDADGDALVHVTVRTLPDPGTLTLNDTPVTVGAVVPAAQLGQLVYKPVADASGDGYASLQFTVNDGTADSATPNTLTFNVTAENDAPTAEDKTLTLAEDGQHTFSADDFGFQDADGDALVHVTVRTLPDQGTLTLNDTPVTVGAVVPAAQLGQLVYKPVADASGDGYATLQFTVNDGTADSVTPNTLTFNVTAENDAPTAEDNGVTVDENGQYAFSAADFGFQDIDGDSLDHITVITLPDTGTLTLAGQQLAADSIVTAAQLEQKELVYQQTGTSQSGTPETFRFTANDGNSDSAVKTITVVTVDQTANNQAPYGSYFDRKQHF